MQRIPLHLRRPKKRWTSLGWPLLAALVFVSYGAMGCSRAHYRLQADQEVYDVVAEKANYPRWRLDGFAVDVAPQSRMYDPTNPDHPPMPLDDPVSHKLMHEVDGKRGYPYWHTQGLMPYADNPDWRSYLPLGDRGVLTLDGASSVRLALLHSSNYQQQIETLYLSAMDVTSERFRFDVQYFYGNTVDFAALGREASGTGQSRSILDVGTNFSAQRFFTTGADLSVGLANSLMWQFSGPTTNSATTILDFTLIQPLLREAGRDRVMETLTLAERTLLGNVRQFQRYRSGFYMDIMTGAGRQQGPTRRGGFFGAAGFSGFTGVGSGGFGGVGGTAFGAGQGGGQEFGQGGGAGAGIAGGFYGLLQLQQSIRNQEANIAALQSSLAQLEAFRDAGRIDFFQVEQVRQQVFQNLSQLLISKRTYQDSLDEFKRDLGLPPEIPISIEDPVLDRFKLIDPTIVPVQNRITMLQRDVGEQIITILPNGEPFMWNDQTRAQVAELQSAVDEIGQLRQTVVEQIVPRVRDDIEILRNSLPNRDAAATRLRTRAAQEQEEAKIPGEAGMLAQVDPSLLDISRLPSLPDELSKNVDDILARFTAESEKERRVTEDIADLLTRAEQPEAEELLAELREKAFAPIPSLLTEFSADVLELSLVQARARAESIILTPVEMDAVDAVDIARLARLDWMNARAALVDTWRLIEFNADSLESVLDVVFSGDISNVGNNPVKFRDTTGALRVGLQFDAPLTRLQERNTYRQALIDYQQARRNYYLVEDAIATQLRAILRQIELNKVNFELRRTAFRVAVAQVQSARLRLEEPPRQTAVDAEGATFGPTVAQDLLSALNALRGAQDDFLSVWVNYEVQRGLLDLSMGTMELDAEGLWIDPGAIGLEFNYPDLQRLEDECLPVFDPGLRTEEVPPGEQETPVDDDQAAAIELQPPLR